MLAFENIISTTLNDTTCVFYITNDKHIVIKSRTIKETKCKLDHKLLLSNKQFLNIKTFILTGPKNYKYMCPDRKIIDSFIDNLHQKLDSDRSGKILVLVGSYFDADFSLNKKICIAKNVYEHINNFRLKAIQDDKKNVLSLKILYDRQKHWVYNEAMDLASQFNKSLKSNEPARYVLGQFLDSKQIINTNGLIKSTLLKTENSIAYLDYSSYKMVETLHNYYCTDFINKPVDWSNVNMIKIKDYSGHIRFNCGKLDFQPIVTVEKELAIASSIANKQIKEKTTLAALKKYHPVNLSKILIDNIEGNVDFAASSMNYLNLPKLHTISATNIKGYFCIEKKSFYRANLCSLNALVFDKIDKGLFILENAFETKLNNLKSIKISAIDKKISIGSRSFPIESASVENLELLDNTSNIEMQDIVMRLLFAIKSLENTVHNRSESRVLSKKVSSIEQKLNDIEQKTNDRCLEEVIVKQLKEFESKEKTVSKKVEECFLGLEEANKKIVEISQMYKSQTYNTYQETSTKQAQYQYPQQTQEQYQQSQTTYDTQYDTQYSEYPEQFYDEYSFKGRQTKSTWDQFIDLFRN